jgi:hypothetical protein
VIRCNCQTDCSTMRCSCKKHGLRCSIACGNCRNQLKLARNGSWWWSWTKRLNKMNLNWILLVMTELFWWLNNINSLSRAQFIFCYQL